MVSNIFQPYVWPAWRRFCLTTLVLHISVLGVYWILDSWHTSFHTMFQLVVRRHVSLVCRTWYVRRFCLTPSLVKFD